MENRGLVEVAEGGEVRTTLQEVGILRGQLKDLVLLGLLLV